jgi:hypothetical protein
MEGIAAAVRARRLSLAFLEAAPYRRWAVRSARTCRQVSQDTGIPLEDAKPCCGPAGEGDHGEPLSQGPAPLPVQARPGHVNVNAVPIPARQPRRATLPRI